eukprot:g83.t1
MNIFLPSQFEGTTDIRPPRFPFLSRAMSSVVVIHDHWKKALGKWIQTHLERICGDEATALRITIMTVLRNRKPAKELKENCANHLEDFLKDETEGFLNDMFRAIDTKSFLDEKSWASASTTESKRRDRNDEEEDDGIDNRRRGGGERTKKMSQKSSPSATDDGRDRKDEDDTDLDRRRGGSERREDFPRRSSASDSRRDRKMNDDDRSVDRRRGTRDRDESSSDSRRARDSRKNDFRGERRHDGRHESGARPNGTYQQQNQQQQMWTGRGGVGRGSARPHGQYYGYHHQQMWMGRGGGRGGARPNGGGQYFGQQQQAWNGRGRGRGRFPPYPGMAMMQMHPMMGMYRPMAMPGGGRGKNMGGEFKRGENAMIGGGHGRNDRGSEDGKFERRRQRREDDDDNGDNGDDSRSSRKRDRPMEGDGGGDNDRVHEDGSRLLHLTSVPKFALKAHKLRSHFSRFGRVANIFLRFKEKEAYVEFVDRPSANRAFRSPRPVCNNRFIKLYWSSADVSSLVEEREAAKAAAKKRRFDQIDGDAAVEGSAGDRGFPAVEVANGANDSYDDRRRKKIRNVGRENDRSIRKRKIEVLRKKIELCKTKLGILKKREASGQVISPEERKKVLLTISDLMKKMKAEIQQQKIEMSSAVSQVCERDVDGEKAEEAAVVAPPPPPSSSSSSPETKAVSASPTSAELAVSTLGEKQAGLERERAESPAGPVDSLSDIIDFGE